MKLGTRVEAKSRLFRFRDGDRRSWRRSSGNLWVAHRITGIYIGVRFYKNGTVSWIGEEEGYTFHAESTIKVALIVTNARHKPIPVLYSEMTELKEEENAA